MISISPYNSRLLPPRQKPVFAASTELVPLQELTEVSDFLPTADIDVIRGIPLNPDPRDPNRFGCHGGFQLSSKNGWLFPASEGRHSNTAEPLTPQQQKSMRQAVFNYLEHLRLRYPDLYQKLAQAEKPRVNFYLFTYEVQPGQTYEDPKKWHRDKGLAHLMNIPLNPHGLTGGLEVKSVKVTCKSKKDCTAALATQPTVNREGYNQGASFLTRSYLHRCTDLLNHTQYPQQRTVLIMGV